MRLDRETALTVHTFITYAVGGVGVLELCRHQALAPQIAAVTCAACVVSGVSFLLGRYGR
jgi:hypothetical protein